MTYSTMFSGRRPSHRVCRRGRAASPNGTGVAARRAALVAALAVAAASAVAVAPAAAQAPSDRTTDPCRSPVCTADILNGILGTGPRTEVLVLATPHLRMLGPALRASALDSLQALLLRFHPTAIAIEALPPAETARLERGGQVEHDLLQGFGAEAARWGDTAQRRLGVSRDSAAVMASVLLDGTAPPTDSVRSLAIAPLLASLDYYSALVNWAAIAGRGAGLPPGLTAADTAALTLALAAPDEIRAIAVPLAVRLGLARLLPFDDHSDDETLLRNGDLQRLAAALAGDSETARLQRDSFYTQLPHRLSAANGAGDLLPVYRYVNSPAYGARDVALQWGMFMRTRLPDGLDRERLALWEARNLSMVHNLRAAAARQAGGRVLVIIGASHKPFLDAYLSQLAGLRLLQLGDLR